MGFWYAWLIRYTRVRGTVGVTSIAGPVDAFRVTRPAAGMGRDRTRVTPHFLLSLSVRNPDTTVLRG